MWITVGILQQQSVALPQIAQSIPGHTCAESRVTQIRRWLMNLPVQVWECYHPLLAHTLRGWQQQDLTVIVDGVMGFGDRLQILRLSLVHGCRAVPIVWKVVVGKGLTTVDCLEPMLKQAAEFLRPRVKSVTLLADRGFRDWDWAALCGKMGWDDVIRMPCNTTLTLASGVPCRIDELRVKKGQRRYFQQVRRTLEHQGLSNLSVTWTEGEAKNPPERLAVMSRRPASKARRRRYGLRMQIEQSFRDDKSGGFDWAHTRLRHPERLERLRLAVAIATIWCHELGERCLKGGERCRRWRLSFTYCLPSGAKNLASERLPRVQHDNPLLRGWDRKEKGWRTAMFASPSPQKKKARRNKEVLSRSRQRGGAKPAQIF